MYLTYQLFLIKANSNDFIGLNDTIQIKKERSHTDTLLIYTLWYELSNDFEAQSEFGKCHKKADPLAGTILILSML